LLLKNFLFAPGTWWMGPGRINREGEFHSHSAAASTTLTHTAACCLLWQCVTLSPLGQPPRWSPGFTFLHRALFDHDELPPTHNPTASIAGPTVIRREFTAPGPISDSLARFSILFRSSLISHRQTNTRRRHQLPFLCIHHSRGLLLPISRHFYPHPTVLSFFRFPIFRLFRIR
jgi:hypothetical protein